MTRTDPMTQPGAPGADNRVLLEQIFAGLAEGNSRLFVDSMADTFQWTITGQALWSGTYDGKRAVVEQLFGTLRAALAPPIRTIAHRFVADGDRVVVEARGDNRTHAGVPYRNSYCFVFRVEGGLLTEVVEYMDSALAESVLGPPPGGSEPRR